MKNKYYTPSLEEFHVGFEYEITNRYLRKPDWEKEIIESISDLNDLDYKDIERDKCVNIRVKYLGEKDIESLGYEVPEESLLNGRLTKRCTKDNVTIWFDSNFTNFAEGSNISITVDDVIRCKGADNNFKQKVLFRGYIKNLSILKQVLKMIGVIE